MRCTCRGAEASPEDADEPVGGAARELDDEKVRCLECIICAHHAPARLGQWVQGPVRKNPLRRVAKRQGRTLMKFRSRESQADDSDHRSLATVDDSHHWHIHLPVGPDAESSLDGVEEYLIYRTTHAEIVEYLTQAYGSAFVEDLIKHLPQTARGDTQWGSVALPDRLLERADDFEDQVLGDDVELCKPAESDRHF